MTTRAMTAAPLRLGTRASLLATTQSGLVADALRVAERAGAGQLSRRPPIGGGHEAEVVA